MAKSVEWIPFPVAFQRADDKNVDRTELANALLRKLATDDSAAIARGWAQLTEFRWPSLEENRAKVHAQGVFWRHLESLGSDPDDCLAAMSEEERQAFEKTAQSLREAAEFEPEPIRVTLPNRYEIPSDFWANCEPPEAMLRSDWRDDEEEPCQWTEVEWLVGSARCFNILPGISDIYSDTTWEFTALEISDSALRNAIMELDKASGATRDRLMLDYPLDNYSKAWTYLSKLPQFDGISRDAFIARWREIRQEGKRGQKPATR